MGWLLTGFAMSAPTLRIANFAQLHEVEIAFGDLTVLVGPQATGKSLVLQLLKLAVDATRVAGTLQKRGFAWKGREEFCAVYFGEGMDRAWTDATKVIFSGRAVHAPPRKRTLDSPRLFYIPAHRTLSVAEGWPAGFRSYKPDTPFVVRDFSEQLLELLTTRQGTEGNVVFPQPRRLKQPFRELVDEAVFHGGQLKLLSDGPRRQFKLVYPHAEIAYMAWTAGQREFIPLLLGIYHLVPLGVRPRTGSIEWVVIEEPEMGLHSNAIRAVMLLILELMDRGYRVAVSTHSPAIVEVLWALRQIKTSGANPNKLRNLFSLERARWDVDRLARNVLQKEYRVYYLDYVDPRAECARSLDISALDPESSETGERTWGHLLSLSSRVNAAVADVVPATLK
jgi:energy-coupling factor transporter ATP-binding protein EcfA2